jgi:hypothetical protein
MYLYVSYLTGRRLFSRAWRCFLCLARINRARLPPLRSGQKRPLLGLFLPCVLPEPTTGPSTQASANDKAV